MALTLAQSYQRHADHTLATSPLQARVAAALAASLTALGALERLPPRRRQPPLVLAALHDLALDGRAPALATAYARGDPRAAADAAVSTLVTSVSAVADLVARRQVRTIDAARCAVLQPALAHAARTAGATAVGLVDLGPVGLNLHLDRVSTTYSDGRSLGDPASPVRLTCRLVGDRDVPATEVPEVTARMALDRDPLDPSDPADARWLRACLAPDDLAAAARLDAELAVVTARPPLLVSGDPLVVLAAALGQVPADALPVVVTTWALSRLPVDGRRRFLDVLTEAGAVRPVAWASVEGVGVAPSVPTLGDRVASGHSIVGLVLATGSGLHAEALGRCWSRGRVLAWLAADGPGGPWVSRAPGRRQAPTGRRPPAR